MKICEECYVDTPRATPLLHAQDCLENHIQYICGTCGRVICFNKDDKRQLQRWNFPFKSLDIAKLYLRTADIEKQTTCGIYEIISANGRKSYKIFENKDAVLRYLTKNKKASITSMTPLYQQDTFTTFTHSQIRKLTTKEITTYLKEKE
jgi:hypothetical protein